MGVVQAHRFGNEYYATRRIFFWYQSWRWPRVHRARFAMDATPADPAGGGDRASAASSTSTAAAEVSATHRFTRRSAIFCPVSQLHPSIMSLGSVGTYGRRGGRDPDVPPIAPRLASMHNRAPTAARSRPRSKLPSRRQILAFGAVFRVLICACSESSRLAQRHPKVCFR